METKKILMITSFYPPYHVGGDATHVKYLSESLVKQGHEVHVMYSIDAYNLKKGEKTIKEENEENENFPIIHKLKSPIGRFEPIFNYTFGTQYYTFKIFRNLIKENKFDIVHYHNISLLGYRILKKLNNYHYKRIYTAHGYWSICPLGNLFKENKKICHNLPNQKFYSCISCLLKSKRPIQIWRYLVKYEKYFRSLDCIIAPSLFMKKKLMEKKINSKIYVIPNFVPDPPDEKIIKKIKYGDYFLYAGALEENKGIGILMKTFLDREIKSKLIIVGTGSLYSKVKKLVEKKNKESSKKILFFGWAEKNFLYSLYYYTNALILPSLWYENAPLSVLECLSVGTPVIGANIGGIPEILEKIDPDLIFNGNKIETLKEKILNFNKVKYSRKEIKEVWRKNFSEEIYLKRYLKIIK